MSYSYYAAVGWRIGAVNTEKFYVCRDANRGRQILNTTIVSGPYDTMEEAVHVAASMKKGKLEKRK